MSEPRHLFVYNLQHHSHSIAFIEHWFHYWSTHNQRDRLTVMISRGLLDMHPQLADWESRCATIQIITITSAERNKRERLHCQPSGLAIEHHRVLANEHESPFAGFYDWELFCRYADKLKASHSVQAYMDHSLPLLARPGPAPKCFSGILFRPLLQLPASDVEDSVAMIGKQVRDKFFISRALRHDALHSLFVIDEDFPRAVQKFSGSKKVAYLPEVAHLHHPTTRSINELKRALLVEKKIVFLFFGELSRRKNIKRFLAALTQLPAALTQRVAVLLSGFIQPGYLKVLEKTIVRVESQYPVQVIRRYGYAKNSEAALYLHLADVVVTLYDAQLGSSNVNLLAAAAGTPVMTSNQSVVGRVARRWQLGLTVDVQNTESIAAGIRRVLKSHASELGNYAAMQELAMQHTPEKFCATFFNRLGFCDSVNLESEVIVNRIKP